MQTSSSADPLAEAARRLGVPTDASAGPGAGLPERSIWARWPRDRRKVAEDTLARLLQLEPDAGIASAGPGGLWRAHCGRWSYTAPFEKAVAALALHVLDPAHAVARRPRDSHPGATC